MTRDGVVVLVDFAGIDTDPDLGELIASSATMYKVDPLLPYRDGQPSIIEHAAEVIAAIAEPVSCVVGVGAGASLTVNIAALVAARSRPPRSLIIDPVRVTDASLIRVFATMSGKFGGHAMPADLADLSGVELRKQLAELLYARGDGLTLSEEAVHRLSRYQAGLGFLSAASLADPVDQCGQLMVVSPTTRPEVEGIIGKRERVDIYQCDFGDDYLAGSGLRDTVRRVLDDVV